VSHRVLCIDHGKVRIGLALSDPLGIVAHPLVVVPGGPAAIDAIAEIVAEREVAEVVVGLPRNMDGSLGPQAEAVEAFVARLRTVLPGSVRTWDERLSSQEADRTLDAMGIPLRKRKGRRDKIAAGIILQSFLDAQNRVRPSEPPPGGVRSEPPIQERPERHLERHLDRDPEPP
jgi:putative Holliday junction resolvase